MKESYEEDVANHFGLKPYAEVGNNLGVASERGTGRQAIELRNHLPFVCRPSAVDREGNMIGHFGEAAIDTAES